ncbi:MAG: alpha/beta hydrolase [Thermoanaerobaculia bacterium]
MRKPDPAPGAESDPLVAALAAQQPDLALRERFLDLPGVRLHVVEAGPAEGRPVLLLHGFPEFWWGWRRQIAALVDAGRRVVIPDLRGYNRSGKPKGLRAYGLDALTDDLSGLMDDLGSAPVDVVAHDWGGAVAWWGTLRFPERFARLVILNVPHPSVMRRFLRTNRAQRRRSRYLFYFQLPFFPERKLRAGDFQPFRSIFRRTSRKGTFSAGDLDTYAAAAAQPGAITAMLNWYRAALWYPPQRPTQRIVEPSVHLLWGEDDVALGADMARASMPLCRDGRLTFIPHAGHWVQHEAAERVNELILATLQAPADRADER